MHNNGDGAATLQLIHDLRRQGISRLSVILRHAARAPITSVEHVLALGLSEQGRETARRFGQRLPPGPTLRLCSSPVGRCQETAACIAEGYRAQGGATDDVRIFEQLGPFYISNHDASFRLFEEIGWPRFLRQWFQGQVAPEIMMPAPRAAHILLSLMLQTLREHPGDVCALYLSHDWNIFPLKEHYLGLPHEEFGDVHFLDGLVLYESQGHAYLTHHHGTPTCVDDIAIRS